MAGVSLESPYVQDASALWLKGNLHTHTTRSDGKAEPQEMIDRYAQLGYDFLMLSDHDVLADLAGLDDRGLMLLKGAEISAGGPHVLDVGARRLVGGNGDQQALLEEIAASSGFAVLCHPNWEEDFDHYPYLSLMRLTGYAGIEIFNGVCWGLPGNHLATDKWDRLLAQGREVWGYAHDDAHALEQIGRGWNVVRARERSGQAVLAALRGGSFYASSGVQITELHTDGPMLHLVSDADRVILYGRYGARMDVCEGGELHFDASQTAEPHFRVECCGRGGRVAWTQPFRIRNGAYEQKQARLKALGALDKATLNVLRSPKAPKLTGDLSDPLWAEAPAHRAFFRMPDGAEPPVWTQVQAILAADTLFFGLRCQEPAPDNMKLSVQADGQARIWTNDSVEIFLDVEGRSESYYHLMANAAGYSFAGVVGPRRLEVPAVAVKAGRWEGAGTKGWSVEIALPTAQLQAPTQAGTRWRLHVARNRPTGGGTFVWSWVGSSNHNVTEYGTLAF